MRTAARCTIAFMLLSSPIAAAASGLGAIADARLASLARHGSNYLLGAELGDGGWSWDGRRVVLSSAPRAV